MFVQGANITYGYESCPNRNGSHIVCLTQNSTVVLMNFLNEDLI